MDWILANYKEIVVWLWVADNIAAATPVDWKIGNFPIGKYDNIVVSFVKTLIQKAVDKGKKGD